MTDKRLNPRLQETADVIVRVVSAPGLQALEGRQVSCRSSDVSLRGVRLRTDLVFPVGADLNLEIFFARAARTFSLGGRVVWCRESETGDPSYDAGIEFDRKNPQYADWGAAILLLLQHDFDPPAR